MSKSVFKIVRLPRDLSESVIAIAKDNDLTFNGVVREALDAYIQAQIEGLWSTCQNKENDLLGKDEIDSLLRGVLNEAPDDLI